MAKRDEDDLRKKVADEHRKADADPKAAASLVERLRKMYDLEDK